VKRFPPVYSPIKTTALAQALLLHVQPGSSVATEATASDVIAGYYPGREVLLTDSGTSALTLAILSIKAAIHGEVGSGESKTALQVALPAYCCPDIATAAIGAGVRIMLYDTDPATLQPDWESVAQCLANGASILVVAHLYGRLVDVPLAIALARETGAIVIEDAAQGAGGRLNDRRAGSLAPISVLSFGRGKGINAGGGGAVLYDPSYGAYLANVSSSSASTSMHTLAPWLKAVASEWLSSPILYGIPAALPALSIGKTTYHPPKDPRRIPLSCAALLPDAIASQGVLASRRREVELWYHEQLFASGLEHLTLNCPEGESGALRTPIRLAPAAGMRLIQHGVIRSYPRILADYPEVRPFIDYETDLNGALDLAGCIHTLPTHSLLTLEDRRFLLTTLRTVCRD
jgi:dTDP-4-amino-4,6-dideoxygalactose transaminase